MGRKKNVDIKKKRNFVASFPPYLVLMTSAG